MSPRRSRERIDVPDIGTINADEPMAGATAINGVRVYDVGQGDAIAILDQDNRPFLFLDYGGWQDRPFDASTVDAVMPVPKGRWLMLSHWDQDHWCSANLGQAARQAKWLVPRQITSPSAVMFSLSLDDIHCMPESYVGTTLCFDTASGDCVFLEKIAHAPPPNATDEDCNHSGFALSVLKESSDTVILLPGDAPFDRVGHYRWLYAEKKLRGVVAFHHGSGRHWSTATEQLLEKWPPAENGLEVVFSYARGNSYEHPDASRYETLLPHAGFTHTARLREPRRASQSRFRSYTDLRF